MNFQVCKTCGEEKPISCFEWQKARPSPRKNCKTCRQKARDPIKEGIRHRAYMKEQRLLNPERLRQNWERSTYGVAKEDFNYDSCWICGSKHRLCIDHCHDSNQPRGLLCSNCNVALGNFKDDPAKMIRAIVYLLTGPHFDKKEQVNVRHSYESR